MSACGRGNSLRLALAQAQRLLRKGEGSWRGCLRVTQARGRRFVQHIVAATKTKVKGRARRGSADERMLLWPGLGRRLGREGMRTRMHARRWRRSRERSAPILRGDRHRYCSSSHLGQMVAPLRKRA